MVKVCMLLMLLLSLPEQGWSWSADNREPQAWQYCPEERHCSRCGCAIPFRERRDWRRRWFGGWASKRDGSFVDRMVYDDRVWRGRQPFRTLDEAGDGCDCD